MLATRRTDFVFGRVVHRFAAEFADYMLGIEAAVDVADIAYRLVVLGIGIEAAAVEAAAVEAAVVVLRSFFILSKRNLLTSLYRRMPFCLLMDGFLDGYMVIRKLCRQRFYKNPRCMSAGQQPRLCLQYYLKRLSIVRLV